MSGVPWSKQGPCDGFVSTSEVVEEVVEWRPRRTPRRWPSGICCHSSGARGRTLLSCSVSVAETHNPRRGTRPEVTVKAECCSLALRL